VATSVDKGHGRLERRTLRTTSVLTLHGKWAGLKQGFELKRERTEKGEKSVEVVFGITSLRAERADARRLLELVRGHWLIENRLHRVRDVTLAEDACRVRKGAAPQVLAALRNAVVHLVSLEAAREKGLSRAGACDHLAANPAKALPLLGIPQLE
jgi:predicted transposase YbfD/YdcC